MMAIKLERTPSHRWWWQSHNSPRIRQTWLKSDIEGVEDKVKEMLSLIEEDADSFAKRAEMFYQKKPKLVNLLEEIYRAYRYLAERYDHDIRSSLNSNMLISDQTIHSNTSHGNTSSKLGSPLSACSTDYSESAMSSITTAAEEDHEQNSYGMISSSVSDDFDADQTSNHSAVENYTDDDELQENIVLQNGSIITKYENGLYNCDPENNKSSADSVFAKDNFQQTNSSPVSEDSYIDNDSSDNISKKMESNDASIMKLQTIPQEGASLQDYQNPTPIALEKFSLQKTPLRLQNIASIAKCVNNNTSASTTDDNTIIKMDNFSKCSYGHKQANTRKSLLIIECQRMKKQYEERKMQNEEQIESLKMQKMETIRQLSVAIDILKTENRRLKHLVSAYSKSKIMNHAFLSSS